MPPSPDPPATADLTSKHSPPRPAPVAYQTDAMSVKFEKETTKTTAAVADAVSGKGKDDLLHNVGEALTKGAGPNGYLAVSVARLEP